MTNKTKNLGSQEKSVSQKLTNEDYYYSEDGLLVFTKKYHLKRGYCCKSGCKHCPYDFKKSSKDRSRE